MSEVLISATANRKYDILISRDRENAVLLSARGPQGAPGAGGGGGGSGTVTSVAASGGTTGYSFSGSPITASGTLTLTLSNASTVRTGLGLATTDTPTFAGITMTCSDDASTHIVRVRKEGLIYVLEIVQ